MTNLMKELTDIKKSLPKENLKPKNEEQNLLQPEDFEKDEDQNGHIDYIYSLANMRSSNYKLEPMDWLQVLKTKNQIFNYLNLIKFIFLIFLLNFVNLNFIVYFLRLN